MKLVSVIFMAMLFAIAGYFGYEHGRPGSVEVLVVCVLGWLAWTYGIYNKE